MKKQEKEGKNILKIIIYLSFGIFAIMYLIMFYKMYFPLNKSYAKSTGSEIYDKIQISNASKIDIDNIINKNTSDGLIVKITKKEETLEYLTQYKINKKIPKGISCVVQEGRQGKQEITIKTTYDKQGNIILEEQIGTIIIKSSADKIVEIGGANYTSNYKVKENDTIYITSDILGVWSEPTEDSRKITTLKQNDKVKVVQITQNWYKILYDNINGWIKSECTLYIDSKEEKDENNKQIVTKTKQQILSELNINMNLNKPSGLTLEQFKKVLSDEKDINKIFSQNAEYFYYIEKQYNINGIFVAAVGIHESNWGTSQIALQKNNLFGYGADDSNPYNNAYSFNSYSENIDLLARVFVKYYLNSSGISIYGGEKSIGTYYNGSTLNGVNTKYASDKNWANAVFSHMKYLYNKL